LTTTQLIQKIFTKLGKNKMLLLIFSIGFALLLFFYAKSKRPVYTAKATIFPLTSPSENSLSSSALSGLLGIEGTPKSFSSEASINIIELTLSRNVRQRVAATRLPQFGNSTVTELIVQAINDNKPFYQKAMVVPADSASAASLGSELLKDAISARMSKNGVLEFYFSGKAKNLITPISNVFIDKLSQFYIDLKISKAMADYNFTVGKIDSLQAMLNSVDKKAITLQNTTFFSPLDRLEYELPKENLSMEKSRILRQRDLSVNNREEATWRLQKATPIISILDKPTEPFTEEKSSPIVFLIIGLVAGYIIGALILTGGLVYTYTKSEIYKSLFGNDETIAS
jgi:LPS O-antigen subunit length determinant protein (WzzB/FepE family)